MGNNNTAQTVAEMMGTMALEDRAYQLNNADLLASTNQQATATPEYVPDLETYASNLEDQAANAADTDAVPGNPYHQ